MVPALALLGPNVAEHGVGGLLLIYVATVGVPMVGGMLVAAYTGAGTVAYDAQVVVVAGLGMMPGGRPIVALYRRAKTSGADRSAR
mgnify:CR=1 FL=1